MLKRAGFTMIELIMVIVVMGIISSIGAGIIAKLYENYIKTRAINKLQSQSELVLNQIAKRLESRVKDSVIARQKGAGNFLNYVSITDANDSYQILEWIGKDTESFNGASNPGWSGFIDLNNTATSNPYIKTLGSDLNTTDSIINSLSNGKVRLDDKSAKNRPAIIFKGNSIFDLEDYGWSGADGNYTHKVSYTKGSNDILEFAETMATRPSEIFEQYDLAWSAYAIVPEGSAHDFNLTLHYNYQPWENERYDNNASTSILIKNVSTFKFTKIGDTIRLKLCLHDNNQSGDYNFAFCKERVVY